MKAPLALTAAVLLAVPAAAQGSLFLNELMASNHQTITDEGGDHADWFELFNSSLTPVDLSGMWLSDRPLNPRKWQIPAGTVIPAEGFLLFWADEEVLEGPLHVNFHLNILGETLLLTDTDARGNALLDQVTYPAAQPDVSWGRLTDGAPTWVTFVVSTPGTSNGGGDLCETTVCGDCSGDGQVNIIDALFASRHGAGLITLTGAAFDSCNVNLGAGSFSVDVLDALLIAQIDAGLPALLECCQ